jgi:hypothetical protein
VTLSALSIEADTAIAGRTQLWQDKVTRQSANTTRSPPQSNEIKPEPRWRKKVSTLKKDRSQRDVQKRIWGCGHIICLLLGIQLKSVKQRDGEIDDFASIFHVGSR